MRTPELRDGGGAPEPPDDDPLWAEVRTARPAAPVGLAERVLARVDAAPRARSRDRWIATAAIVVALAAIIALVAWRGAPTALDEPLARALEPLAPTPGRTPLVRAAPVANRVVVGAPPAPPTAGPPVAVGPPGSPWENPQLVLHAAIRKRRDRLAACGPNEGQTARTVRVTRDPNGEARAELLPDAPTAQTPPSAHWRCQARIVRTLVLPKMPPGVGPFQMVVAINGAPTPPPTPAPAPPLTPASPPEPTLSATDEPARAVRDAFEAQRPSFKACGPTGGMLKLVVTLGPDARGATVATLDSVVGALDSVARKLDPGHRRCLDEAVRGLRLPPLGLGASPISVTYPLKVE